MKKAIHDALEAERRFRILTYILSSRNTAANLRDFSIPRSTFYRWKAAHEKEGKAGLFRKKPIAKNYPGQISKEHVEKILERGASIISDLNESSGISNATMASRHPALASVAP